MNIVTQLSALLSAIVNNIVGQSQHYCHANLALLSGKVRSNVRIQSGLLSAKLGSFWRTTLHTGCSSRSYVLFPPYCINLWFENTFIDIKYSGAAKSYLQVCYILCLFIVIEQLQNPRTGGSCTSYRYVLSNNKS